MNNDKYKSILKREWRIPYSGKIMRVISAFSTTEKTIFFFFATIFVISGLSLLYQVNKAFLVTVPDYGGSLSEGVIGFPRFINPLLATSDTDKDLTQLIYSGLLRVDAEGNLALDLADNYTISDDSLTYTFTLKNNIYFQDGTKVTADDVVYTIETAQDINLKSPRETNWSGVVVKKIDDKTISFTLKQPYSPFIQNFTLGILPKHIWNKATIEEFPFSQYNTKPIGSGPYEVGSISYTGSGLPSEYHLKSFNKYILGKPYITDLVIKSYQNETDLVAAYKNSDIESIHGISPKSLTNLETKNNQIILSPLPRIFGVFFNQNVAPILVNKEVRSALETATDKQAIVDTILGGYGQIIDSPVPEKTLGQANNSTTTEEDRIKKAQGILKSAGWKLNDSGIFEKKDKDKKASTTLSFSISTGDAPELKQTANLLQEQWRKMGANVSVKIFEIGDLNQNVIRPRKYDSLFFGEVIGRDLDLYPFWHSSERQSPGLNVALYTNVKVDKALENIRKTTDLAAQATYFDSFNNEIKNDVPAVFTYSPYFIYVIPNKVHNVTLKTITQPAERFNDIYKWFIETNNVWKIFAKNKN